VCKRKLAYGVCGLSVSAFNSRKNMTKHKASNVCLFASLILLAAIAASTSGWARGPANGTKQQRMDCADDARFVCGRFIPDVERITRCMEANKRQLSPQCRRHFR
jgi:hypothetical protein